VKVLRAVLLGLLLATSLSAQAAGPRPGRYVRTLKTPGGDTLTLARYVPLGGGEASPPVLLVADFGFDARAWDFEGRGLAPFLQAQGRDVFVLELRGHGRAKAKGGWGLTDVVAEDVPRALEAIAALRSGPVDVVAQGFAGSLVLAASVKEAQGRLGRVVALSTPVEPSVPNPHVQALLERGGRLSTLALTPEGRRAFMLLYADGARLDARLLSRFRRVGLHNLGSRASSELLAWMQEGDVHLGQEGEADTLKGRLAAYDRPTLLLLPLGEAVAHPEFASPLRELAPRAPVQVRILSQLELMEEDYTHLSVLHGQHAERDVWQPILSFLRGAR
jgi:pimeloyl-ACP methyl ester carboxylesterase